MSRVFGTVIHVGAIVHVNDKFKKRELVIRIDGMYPQEVKFEAKQARTELLDDLRLNQELEVTYALEGRRWDKPDGTVDWFNTLTLISLSIS